MYKNSIRIKNNQDNIRSCLTAFLMTLMLTHINKDGIIHASDSNLTANDGTEAGQAQKTFPIGFLKSGFALAGSYSVGGVHRDKWMTASRLVQSS
jgi:hypothetical protein